MKSKINAHYTVKYEPINDFEYTMYDGEIGVIAYEPYIIKQIPFVINKLNENPKTRQAVMVMNRGDEFMSCFMNGQWQLYEGQLYVTINLRSQNLRWIKKDSNLWIYITKRIIEGLKQKPSKVSIDVNVGNLHYV